MSMDPLQKPRTQNRLMEFAFFCFPAFVLGAAWGESFKLQEILSSRYVLQPLAE